MRRDFNFPHKQPEAKNKKTRQKTTVTIKRPLATLLIVIMFLFSLLVMLIDYKVKITLAYGYDINMIGSYFSVILGLNILLSLAFNLTAVKRIAFKYGPSALFIVAVGSHFMISYFKENLPLPNIREIEERVSLRKKV